MNDYETRRLDKIKANQALVAELDIKPVIPKSSRNSDSKPPAAKRRKLLDQAAPSRTSARIAAVEVKPRYNDEPSIKAVTLPRSTSRKSKTGKQQLGSRHIDDTEPLVPVQDVESIRAGWTAWKPVGEAPTRDEATKCFHFADHPIFTPNKSPAEMLREGCFGGSYYRPLRSRKLGIIVEDDWKELPAEWIEGLDVSRFLISPDYDPDVNKYKRSCGQSIEEWEAAGWISHAHDIRGWFSWYVRYFQGRRCDDDERQVSRWNKCVGETGRWRRILLKNYVKQGVREVFDDGADEDAPEVSPVVHQTCHHWAFEVRQGHLDEMWAAGGR
ncbi:hypothetical protein LTR56_022456 [Elasticomyces elasticus]|nr:hypothetical protein LTR56_022456 [Elasticomyces elasticus]KAK3626805.1 hypothetical protein LTR22_023009 [Elasticomyces elasticus]KAK4905268.1 hypothetical protein LTR49_025418 [Elasticomyces elasticus]KAK5749080.1 hypothetical protein LTS12_020842 [Elasticomyces elasticus]